MRKVSEDYWILFLLISGVFSVNIYRNGTTEFIMKAMVCLTVVIFFSTVFMGYLITWPIGNHNLLVSQNDGSLENLLV
jgi:fucose 4-O-acetylase-like acetyltransferase